MLGKVKMSDWLYVVRVSFNCTTPPDLNFFGGFWALTEKARTRQKRVKRIKKCFFKITD